MAKKKTAAESLNRVQQAPPTKYYSTGSTLLDLAISNKYPGGVAANGHITHIYGANSTAKTVIVQEILGACQRTGGYSGFINSEGTLEYDRADLFGLETGKWGDFNYREEKRELELKAQNAIKNSFTLNKDFVSKTIKDNDNFVCLHPMSIEQMFDEVLDVFADEASLGSIPKNIAIGVDSLSALPSEVELGQRLTEGTYGMSRAKQNSTGFRKYIIKLMNNNVSVIFVDQTRDSVGTGRNNKVSGGNALKFYASTRIWLNKPKRILNKHDVPVGVEINFEVEKNKIAAPFRTGKICVIFDIGIDNVRANIEWLLEGNIESKITKKGSWYQWDEKTIGQGIEPVIVYIEDNNLEKELEEEVVRVWNILYDSPKRKKRYE